MPDAKKNEKIEETSQAHEVVIGDVKVTEPITQEHVLASQGIVVVTNPDGSKSQMSVADAKRKLSELKQLEASLEGKV